RNSPLCPFVSCGLAPPLAHFGGPALPFFLRAPGEGQRVGGDVLGDDAAGANIGALADLHRRDQRRIGADERAGANLGAMLVEAVIVAGDGTGADVSASANAGVADISEMVNLGAFADLGLLDLHEVADMSVGGEARAGSEPRERADRGPRADPRAFDMAEGF